MSELADEVPLWRSPWVWVFVVGAVGLTATRSCFRHVPDAPAPIATLPAVPAVDIDHGAEVAWTAPGDVWVLGMFCGDATPACASASEAMRKLAMVYASTGERAPGFVSIWSDARADDAKAARRARRAQGAELPNWRHLLVYDGGALVSALEAARENVAAGGGGGRDPLWTSLVLVDGRGAIRGFYDHERYEVVSELYHRIDHVRTAEESPGHEREDGR